MSAPLRARGTSNIHRQTGNFLSIAKIIALIPPYDFPRPTHFQEGRGTADLSTALRFGRDDKGEGGSSMESGLGQKPFFITLGGPQAHDSSGRDDNSIAGSSISRESEGKSSGAPHLAKNERDPPTRPSRGNGSQTAAGLSS